MVPRHLYPAIQHHLRLLLEAVPPCARQAHPVALATNAEGLTLRRVVLDPISNLPHRDVVSVFACIFAHSAFLAQGPDLLLDVVEPRSAADAVRALDPNRDRKAG